MEHRWGERVRVDIPAAIATRHAVPIGNGRLWNLSASGGFVAGAFNLRLWAQVQVSVASGASLRDLSLLIAYVSRRSNDGVGLEWCEFAPTAVSNLLRAATIDPAVRFAPLESATFLGHLTHVG